MEQMLADGFPQWERFWRVYLREKCCFYLLDITEVKGNLDKRQSIPRVASYLKAKLITNSKPSNHEE
jgi:hypothetical protein